MTLFGVALALLLHLVPGGVQPLRAQSSRKDDIVFNSRGIPLAGATVRVCAMPASGQPCSPLAQIYSDAALTQALANPTTTDGLGNYFFYAAPGKYMVEVSGPGISTRQIPNVILPNDPSSPTFSSISSTGAVNAFSLNLTGNLNVNGSTTVVGSLASGTLNLSNQASPPGAASAGSVNLYTKSTDKKLYYKDDTGTETGPVGNGGGANPNGNNGDLQSKNGTNLQAAGLNDNGSTVAITRDQQSAGPNPHFDLRAYGGYISPATNTMTCSITAGSTTLTCTSNPDFKDPSQLQGASLGHGVVIPGAGALPTIAAPGTPTVTPNLLNGSTTWNYKVIAEDYKGGLTAATAAGTTTTGPAALGVTTVNVTGAVLTNGTATYTTATPHNLQPGNEVLVCQFGGGTCPGLNSDSFNGRLYVQSTPSSTTFTAALGNLPDTSESPSTAQLNVLACNTLTFPAGSGSGAGTLRYWIYRAQGAGAYSLAGVAVGLDPYFVDCGGAAMTNLPSYLPATPPASPQAGYLATTIAGGGGTNTLTLASAATTSVSSVVVQHDNSSNLLAALSAAASQGGGTVYIPSSPNSGGSPVFWPFSALTNFTLVPASNSSYVTVLVNGYVGVNQPWILRSGMKIEGMTKRNSSFMYQGGAQIGGYAHPILYANTVNSLTLRNLWINGNVPQQSALYFDNSTNGQGSTGVILENVGIAAQNNTSGTARPVVLKGGFDYFLRQTTCDPQLGSGVLLPRPCLEFTNSSSAAFNGTSQVPGRVVIESSYFTSAGISINAAPNNSFGGAVGFHFKNDLAEAMLTPFLRVGPIPTTTDFSLQDVVLADQPSGFGTPAIDSSGSKLLEVAWIGGQMDKQYIPLFIGAPGISTLNVINAPTTNLGNTSYLHISPLKGEVNNEPFNATGSGQLNYAMAAPGPCVGCAVTSGGSIAVGTHSIAFTAVDYDGNETVLGTPVTLTTTSGNQTITGNAPTLPNGAAGFALYDNGARRSVGTGCTPPQITGSGTAFTYNGSTCGNSQPSVSFAGSSEMASGGISTYRLRLNGAALTGISGSSSTAATARGTLNQGHLPVFDGNGNVIDSGISPSNVTDFFNRASGNLGSEANSPWTIESGSLLVTAGAVGGNSSGQNYAVFTGVGFPNDDQSVSATWVKSGTPTTQVNALVLRGSATALTNYNCNPSNSGNSLTIGKFVGGSYTALVTQSATINSGDVVSFNVSGSSLNCYVNGVPIAATTDSSISGGFPGLGGFQLYNNNSANLQWKNWMASPGYVSLQRPQTWSQVQTFTPGVTIGSEQMSASPRGPLNVFFPGALTNTWTGLTWTLDKAITVTRLQVQAKTAAAGCTTNAVIRVSDGTTPVNLTLSAAANDSGGLSQNYPAGATLTISVQTAAAGCSTPPADANAVMQYRMQ